jgi:hypothetical protein
MTITERLTAALTDEVLVKAQWAINYGWSGGREKAYADMRAVLIAALLPVVEERTPFKLDVSKEWCEAAAKAEAAAGDPDCTVGAEGPTPAPGATKLAPLFWLSDGEVVRLRQHASMQTRMLLDEIHSQRRARAEAAPPDDTLARVAPTCATCKHFGPIKAADDYFDEGMDCTNKLSPAYKGDCRPSFGCTLHEALRPDAPEVK